MISVKTGKMNKEVSRLTSILDKLVIVLEDFRQTLTDFQNSCECNENFQNKLYFDELEVNYKTIVEQYNQQKSHINEGLTKNCGNYCFFCFEFLSTNLFFSSDLIESNVDQSTADPNASKDDITCEYENFGYTTTNQKNVGNHMRRTQLNSELQCIEPTLLNKPVKSIHSVTTSKKETQNKSPSLPLQTTISLSENNTFDTNEDHFVFGNYHHFYRRIIGFCFKFFDF